MRLPLTELQLAQVARLIEPLVNQPMPAAARAKLRHGYRVDGLAVILFESRPRFDRPKEWRDEEVAKFRYVVRQRVWRLYCQFRDLKWHLYEPYPESPALEDLIEQVKRDPTCIFWG